MINLKSKTSLMIVWCLTFVLSVFLILYIPNRINGNVITALAFVCVGYFSQFFLWLSLTRKAQRADNIFKNMPIAVVSCTYLVIASLYGIVCSAFQNIIFGKIAIIIHVVIVTTAWCIIAALLGSKEHIQRVDSRQKNHHVEL